MLIFQGDRVLAARDALADPEERPSSALRCSLDFPRPWQELTPWCEVDEAFQPPAGSEWLGLRQVWGTFGDGPFARAGAAWQYMSWWRNVRLCSFCGAPLVPRQEDRGRRCVECGRTFYAPLSPAIITAIEREGKLLLAHNLNMPAGRFSVLAGFVEPGETLEQTVSREVMEEVSIEVQDIRYFGSQSWPFPCSLMLGFTARWKGGELRPDGVEIEEAGWFAPQDIPKGIPNSASISRRLIDHFIATHSPGCPRP